MDSDINEYIKAGADMVLPKPLQIDALEKLLSNIEIEGFYSPTYGKR